MLSSPVAPREEAAGTAPLPVVIDFKLGRGSFNFLREIIYRASGIHLKDAKRQMVQSRLTKRLRYLRLGSFEEYIEYLEGHPEELTDMVNRITTNKTHFFREPKHFQFLEEQVFPEMVSRVRPGTGFTVNGWCAASSTGEEPYSLALVMTRFFSGQPGWPCRLLASDLDTHVLSVAEKGEYPATLRGDIPKQFSGYLRKHLGGEGNLFGFSDEVRRIVHFRQINLMAERYPIRTPLDFIFCRNVFIYFTREDRDRIVGRFISLLKTGGYLFLGHSEVLDTESFRDRLRFVGQTTYQKVCP